MIVKAEVVDRDEFHHLLRPLTYHGIELEEAHLFQLEGDEVAYDIGQQVMVSIEYKQASILGVAT